MTVRALSDRNVLIVEGEEEKHVLPFLLDRHIIWGDSVDDWPCRIKPFGGIRKILAKGAISAELKASDRQAVGIVIDANSDLDGRFKAIRHRVTEVYPDFPDSLPKDGLIWLSPDGVRVGVWAMPNNQDAGMLETLLASIVHEDDYKLFEYVKEVVAESRNRGARFHESHVSKAMVHTYLALHEDPGCSLGIATLKRMFDAHHPDAQAFVNWFVLLNDVESLKRPHANS